MVAILDYGFGNLKSVYNALYVLGEDPVFISNPCELEGVERLIVPGVGSFDTAMGKLERGGWPGALLAFAAAGRPLLGICLGMQILSEFGEEGAGVAGLGLVPGRVIMLSPDSGLNIPHAGWNTVKIKSGHPVFEGLPPQSDFYFVHSYCYDCNSDDLVLGETDYGGVFCSVVGCGNVLGVQFHPEKSQKRGLKILENFCAWDGKC